MTNQFKTMGKQFKAMTAIAIVSMMTLASCSNEDGETTVQPSDNFSVNLSFKNSANSRAVGAAAVDGTKIEIADGYLCFAAATGVITDVYTISSAETAGKNISNAGLNTTINEVPGNTTTVCLIANKGSLTTVPAVGGNLSTFLSSKMAVQDQNVYTKVTCVDTAELTAVEPGKKAAAISLETKVARIQVKGLTFEGIASGKVAGIFINGFYTEMELDGDGVGTLASSFDKAMYVAGSSVFTTALQSYVYDTFEENIAASVTPLGVWGYNLFASATPQIIIKLTDVVTTGGYEYEVPQFVTVNGFKSGATQVNNLVGGMIYTIEAGALIIKPEHLNPEPGVTPFAVSVTVSQAEWDETVVVPNL